MDSSNQQNESYFTPDREVLKKVIIACLIFCFVWLGFRAVEQTSAYFFDQERSGDNLIAAGILDITVTGDPVCQEEITYDKLIPTILAVADGGDIRSQHGLRVETEGELCEYLEFSAYYLGEYSWEAEDVSLIGFNTDLNFAPGVWNFVVKLPSEHRFKTGDCAFDFIFSAVQETENNNGYWDLETINNWVGTGGKDEFEIIEVLGEEMMEDDELKINNEELIIKDESEEEEETVEEDVETRHGASGDEETIEEGDESIDEEEATAEEETVEGDVETHHGASEDEETGTKEGAVDEEGIDDEEITEEDGELDKEDVVEEEENKEEELDAEEATEETTAKEEKTGIDEETTKKDNVETLSITSEEPPVAKAIENKEETTEKEPAPEPDSEPNQDQ